MIEVHLPAAEIGSDDQGHGGVFTAKSAKGSKGDRGRRVEHIQDTGLDFPSQEKPLQLHEIPHGADPMGRVQGPHQGGGGPLI
jgi:hypothetical protein